MKLILLILGMMAVAVNAGASSTTIRQSGCYEISSSTVRYLGSECDDEIVTATHPVCGSTAAINTDEYMWVFSPQWSIVTISNHNLYHLEKTKENIDWRNYIEFSNKHDRGKTVGECITTPGYWTKWKKTPRDIEWSYHSVNGRQMGYRKDGMVVWRETE